MKFFLSESNIGQSRAAANIGMLSELNPYSKIVVTEEYPTEELIKIMQVVVVSGVTLNECIRMNELARKYGLCYLCADTRGLFGYVFADFGPCFTVIDVDGEEPISRIVSHITKEERSVVTCVEDVRHGLSDGTYVRFSDVKGMTELNDAPPFKVEVYGPFTFGIGDTSKYTDYENDGIFTQVKMPVDLKFKTLKESLKDPDILISDFAKEERPMQLHIAFQALSRFLEIYKYTPAPRDAGDADKFLQLSKDIATENDYDITIDEKIIREFSYQACGKLPSMTSVIGGFVSQEVLKACSNRFTPLKQFFYFDSLESLPSSTQLTPQSCSPLNSRYDPQIAVLGADFVNSMHNVKTFLVGSGAIGCEMLKIWALSGLGSGEKGSIVVTDMDIIEKSNLNRQFLFRPGQIGQAKSVSACAAATEINPNLRGKLVAKEDRVGEDTEAVFNEEFWNSLSFVTNALDNVDARKYVDSKCVFHRKALVDSGTLGTKANTQVVIPFLTESYSSSNDPPEVSIPVCTLKNFPNAIEHTIQWARDLFDGYFSIPVKTLKLYLDDEKFLAKMRRQAGGYETLLSIYDLISDYRPKKFADCVKWARLKFQELFSNTIRQLLFNFPPGARTSSGTQFWSGPKRMPVPIEFDINNSLHLCFIMSAANISSQVHNIEHSTDMGYVKSVLENLKVPTFEPKSGIKIAVTDNELSTPGDPCQDVDSIISKIPPPQEAKSARVSSVEFEKDNDENFHMDFVYSAASLRAINYSIKVASRHKVKLVAGRIIPAIATTTSLVSGLAMLELYKIIDCKKNIECYKNGFINLSLPFFSFSEPLLPPKGSYNGKNFTLWDRFEIDYDIALQDLVDYFQNEHELEISMLSCGTTLVFAPFLNKKKAEERGGLPMSKVVESIRKSPIPSHINTLVLDAIVTDKFGVDVSTQRLQFMSVTWLT